MVAPMESLTELAARLGEALTRRGWCLAVAESCTGGWIAKTVTDVTGASAWFDRAWITYSNVAKQDMLGVAADCLAEHGAVSEATVRQMAEGALARSGAQRSVAVSGVAGPGGGTAAKPVGTVWLAWAGEGMVTCARRFQFDGDREAVRRQAVAAALQGLLDSVA